MWRLPARKANAMTSESLRTLERNLQNPQTQTEREIAVLGPWFHNLHLPGGSRRRQIIRWAISLDTSGGT